MTVTCPNCGDNVPGLYSNEFDVSHCGCFHEKDPSEVRFHLNNFVGRDQVNETKCEIRARMDEIEKVLALLAEGGNTEISDALIRRAEGLKIDLETAQEDLFKSVIQSHKVLCAVKKMDEDAAFGQDPAMYYTMGVCGEAGEMANKIVKALRNGNDPEAAKRAVMSELPDVFIYGAVLAYVLDIDLTRLVNDKVQVVMDRAREGYYGQPLSKPDG